MLVKQIKKIPFNGNVYNFHCLPNEYYFSHGVLVHNCYKGNTKNGKNMSLETYKHLLSTMPSTLTQVALGGDSDCSNNPDIWKIMEHTREKGIIPNITVANISKDTAKKLATYCGAVAVSRYNNKDWCYDSVKYLVDEGMDQINIHMMLSKSTYDQAIETINDYHNDSRLNGMNAIVFLSLKKCGRGKNHDSLDFDQFKYIIDLSMEKNIKFGFDSCSAPKFLAAIKGHKNYEALEQCSEPCESSLFSSYFNVDAEYFPCSFTEGHGSFKGIKVENNFIDECWKHPDTVDFRENLLKNNRNCPLYDI